jgi:hypothetical protein
MKKFAIGFLPRFFNKKTGEWDLAKFAEPYPFYQTDNIILARRMYRELKELHGYERIQMFVRGGKKVKMAENEYFVDPNCWVTIDDLENWVQTYMENSYRGLANN